jgi:adenylate cyclase
MADNPPVQRRLAAILAADVVGYSRLMGADEEGTLGQQKAVRGGPIDRELLLSGLRPAIGEAA